MRDELHLMELVDRYLDGGMGAAEGAAFEERMRMNGELQGLVNEQRALREGLHRVQLRHALASAHRTWAIQRWIPWVIAGVVILFGGYWVMSSRHSGVEQAAVPMAMPILEIPQVGHAIPSDTALAVEGSDIQVESVFVRSKVWPQDFHDTIGGEGRVVTHLIMDDGSRRPTTQEPVVLADAGAEHSVAESPNTATAREYNAVEQWRRDAVADSACAPEQERKELLARVEHLENATKPVYPGGMEGMQRFLDTHVVQPRGSRKAGMVMVGFTVNKKGEVVNVEVVRGLGRLFDAEAIRVVSSLPMWEASRLGDRPVKSRVEVPVRFPGREKKEGRRNSGSAQPQDLVK